MDHGILLITTLDDDYVHLPGLFKPLLLDGDDLGDTPVPPSYGARGQGLWDQGG